MRRWASTLAFWAVESFHPSRFFLLGLFVETPREEEVLTDAFVWGNSRQSSWGYLLQHTLH